MTKTTQELLDILKTAPTIDDYANEAVNNMLDCPLCDCLQHLLQERGMSRADLAKRSGLDRTYTYQIMDGTKRPSRDKVLTIFFTLGLSLDEVQTLLKSTGYPALYARIERDSVLIFALMRNASITNVNELLYELGLDPLTQFE